MSNVQLRFMWEGEGWPMCHVCVCVRVYPYNMSEWKDIWAKVQKREWERVEVSLWKWLAVRERYNFRLLIVDRPGHSVSAGHVTLFKMKKVTINTTGKAKNLSSQDIYFFISHHPKSDLLTLNSLIMTWPICRKWLWWRFGKEEKINIF